MWKKIQTLDEFKILPLTTRLKIGPIEGFLAKIYLHPTDSSFDFTWKNESGLFDQANYDIDDDSDVDSLGVHAFVESLIEKVKIIDCDLSLNGLILEDEKKQAIINLIKSASIEKREKLFNRWGFGRTMEKGKGIAMLFFGPPGTGKTKCAELIAREIGFDFKLLDTAELWSSEPGKTERNLKKAFENATRAGKSVLCFDECDSLIYDRNRVGMVISAEINCLLSELERFEGITIFTTNRVPKLDKAFQRRLQLKLEFEPPTKKLRHKIWEALIPKECPLASDVCLKTLSTSEITGGNIKNVALNAARFAIIEDREAIEMRHFEKALRLELEGIAGMETDNETLENNWEAQRKNGR